MLVLTRSNSTSWDIWYSKNSILMRKMKDKRFNRTSTAVDFKGL